MDKITLLKSKLQALRTAGHKDSDPDIMSLKMQISELESLNRLALVPTITGSKTVLLGSASKQKASNRYVLLGSIAALVVVGYLAFKRS